MFWIENANTILALHSGEWHGFTDSFLEGEPEIPAGAPTPPTADLRQPIRGFGKVWVGIAEQMGFGTAEEGGYYVDYQPFQGGWLLVAPQGEIIVLQGEVGPERSGPFQLWRGQDSQWERLSAP